jgi:sn-glycerol 3-phosphate transport system substrate-binding protein
VPTYKGSYDESMTAAIAAFRAGNAPHILQVFEVGTATMMASKGAIVPVGKVMADAGVQVRPQGLRAGRGRLLHRAQRPDAELPVQQLDHGASTTTRTPSRPPAWTPTSRPRPGPKWRWPPPSSRPAATSARSPPAGRAGRSSRASRPGTTSSSPPSATASAALDTRLAFNTPLHVRHIENLANMAKQGLFVYKGRNNAADATFPSGECAMYHRLVGAVRQHQAQRQVRGFGIATLPYYPDVPGAPQNTVIGGASLWVMAARSPPSTRAWPILQLPVQPEVQAKPATSAPATCRSPRPRSS